MALISNVVTGGTITAAWGNAIRDTTVQITTSSARPTSPTEGQHIYETDTDRLLVYDGSAWVRLAQSTTSGRTGCTVRQVAGQSLATASGAYLSFDTEDFDSDGFITAPSTTITIPTGLGGIYAVSYTLWLGNNSLSTTASIVHTPSSPSGYVYNYFAAIANNGGSAAWPTGTNGYTMSAAATIPLLAGETLKFNMFQTTGSGQTMWGRVTCYRIGL